MTTYSLELPEASFPDYTYSTFLDGIEYRLNFKYYTRKGLGWHIKFFDKEGELLIGSTKLIANVNLFYPHTREALPKGSLVLNALFDGVGEIPTLENLSTHFGLFYDA